MKKIETIIILAGGDSTRFWPLTTKQLMPYVGKPFIAHIVEGVSELAEKIIIVSAKATTNATAELIKDMKNVEVVTQKNEDEGLGWAVATLQGQLVGEALILSGSDLLDFSTLQQFIDTSRAKKTDFAILAQKKDSYFPGGYLRFEGDTIKEIVEKPKEGTEPSPYVKLVADYCADIASFIQTIESTKEAERDSYEVAINELLKSGKRITFQEYGGPWHALKYPWHVLPAMLQMLKEIKKYTDQSAKVSQTAIVEGEVYIGKNVTIGDFTKLVGPLYIEDNAVIGDYCMVRQSQIGEGALIGGYSEVTRSYLGKGVMLHRNYVGDSVLAKDVLLGAGAATANFRFDTGDVRSEVSGEKVNTGLHKLGAVVGSGSKIGVHATILPGVKIGRKTFIGPGTVVSVDVEDNTFLHDGKKSKNKY